MLCVWFIAGPPFDVTLWADTAERMEKLGVKTRCHPILRSGDGDLRSEACSLSSAISSTDDDVVLVGHGTALPLIVEVARSSTLHGIAVTNGPLVDPDPLTRALCSLAKLPSPMSRLVFHPSLSLRFLASSMGLRRAVVNPYVMEHDTIVTICGPILSDPVISRRARTYLQSIAKLCGTKPNPDTPTLVCWGDSDPLTYRNYLSFKSTNPRNTDFMSVLGGRYLHPVERPWELADALLSWTQNLPTAT